MRTESAIARGRSSVAEVRDIYEFRMMQGLKRAVPGDVIEELGVVQRSVGYRTWDATEKGSISRAITSIRKGEYSRAIGYLRSLSCPLPKSRRIVDRSIERLGEIL